MRFACHFFAFCLAGYIRMTDSKKQIKMLELAIQHGEEKKVDYNPIDRLVGVYQDIVKTRLLTIEEYAERVRMKPFKR